MTASPSTCSTAAGAPADVSPALPGHLASDASSAPRAAAARQRRVLAAVCLAAATLPMAFTGPAVALGAIADDLQASAAALAWVTNAFMLSFGGAMLPAGALADRVGRRRVFRGGAWLFLVASALLPMAPGIAAFNLLRALQGLGGAALLSAGAALLAQEVDGAARTRAFSWMGTSFGIGLVLGPVTAGALSAAFGWRAIVALLMAAIVLSLALGAGALRESRDPAAARFDWPGAALFSTALTLLTTAVLQAPARGWGDPWVLGGLVAAGVLFAAFARVERRSPAPMLDLSLFRHRRFLGIQLLAAAPAYAFVVLLVLLPIRFAGIEGASPAMTGWWMAALSGPLLALPLAAGRATRWWSPATVCAGGLLVAAAGLWWLGAAAEAVQALPAMALIGVGISGPWGLMDGLAVSVVPPRQAGMAAGIFSTVRVAGEGVALALVGAVLTALIQGRLPVGADGPALAQALAAGRLAQALALQPALGPDTLVQAYEAAFSALARGLAVVTMLSAFVVLAMLRPAAAASTAATNAPAITTSRAKGRPR
ncbi:MFS transporter [Mitsuaria sp. GD03876]|uniref:MFS transporter n=1 Tax=Mitsuaria sp. GD03876 TaxID=2975399 RepID=UPI002448ACAB|nr:MFS transporter [Mitsuaria sp. GD03876]MDH0865042.1 MFS transporter [Mitsuaria sp. GD03876]